MVKTPAINTIGEYQEDHDDQLSTDPSCTHAGAPLDSIDLVNGMILCPFHGVCFDVMTGKPKGPPAFNHFSINLALYCEALRLKAR